MKIVVAFDNYGAYRFLSQVLKLLHERGHSITVVTPPSPDVEFKAFLDDTRNFDYQPMIFRTGTWRQLTRASRYVLLYANFLRPNHPTSIDSFYVQSLLKKSPAQIRSLFMNGNARRLLSKTWVRFAMRAVEACIPPDKQILKWLDGKSADLVISCPFINYISPDIEYVKAAQKLGIKTVAAIRSWDNLATKGTFHLLPDLVLVWNQIMKNEALSLHDNVPEEIIRITGAPVFDYLFEMKPWTRQEFCQRAGLDADKPFITYVGGTSMAETFEIPVVKEFSRLLKNNPETRDVTVLLRPHPSRNTLWQSFSAENVIIWPKTTSFPHSFEGKQELLNTLKHSQAVLGLNTTAQIDGAVANRPSVLLLLESTRQVQTDFGHFKNILNAGFLEIANSIPECIDILSAIVKGRDLMAENRRRFIQEYVRPRGLSTPASDVMARDIEDFATSASS